MDRRNFLMAGTSVVALFACQIGNIRASLKSENVAVQAPFEMPTITIPNFTGAPEFAITEFGAKRHDRQLTSRAISAAIDSAHNAGGGTVLIPPGRWQTGPIHFRSNVNLHVSEGAELIFSEDPSDYLPAVQTTWEGMECYNYSPLIYAYECENIALTGKGLLFAMLDTWKIWYGRPPEHMAALTSLYHMAAKGVPIEQRYPGANLRPHFVQFNQCRHILVENISIENSSFWVLHPFCVETSSFAASTLRRLDTIMMVSIRRCAKIF